MSDDAVLPPDEEAALSAALAAAYRPSELSRERHELLLRDALEDPLAPPSAAELEAAERLRRELERGDQASGEAALARALALAAGSAGADPVLAERVLDRVAKRPRSNVVFVTFGALTSALAVAAAIALILNPVREAPAPAGASLARRAPALSRSLGPVIGPEANNLSPTARMDRIASARGRELRENRYLAWGVH